MKPVKDVVSRAAFVRPPAKEKARELLDRESRITMTARDFDAFTQAFNGAFEPKEALKKAMGTARKIKHA